MRLDVGNSRLVTQLRTYNSPVTTCNWPADHVWKVRGEPEGVRPYVHGALPALHRVQLTGPSEDLPCYLSDGACSYSHSIEGLEAVAGGCRGKAAGESE